MSELTDILDADVAAVEPELPVQFLFKSKEYTGSKTQTLDSLEMEDAGFIQKYDFELDVRTLAFGAVTPPGKQDEIQIASIRYQVNSITASQDGVMLTLHLNALN